jgi:hypothetical protein
LNVQPQCEAQLEVVQTQTQAQLKERSAVVSRLASKRTESSSASRRTESSTASRRTDTESSTASRHTDTRTLSLKLTLSRSDVQPKSHVQPQTTYKHPKDNQFHKNSKTFPSNTLITNYPTQSANSYL